MQLFVLLSPSCSLEELSELGKGFCFFNGELVRIAFKDRNTLWDVVTVDLFLTS